MNNCTSFEVDYAAYGVHTPLPHGVLVGTIVLIERHASKWNLCHRKEWLWSPRKIFFPVSLIGKNVKQLQTTTTLCFPS